MNTKVIRIEDNINCDIEKLKEAADIIKRGGLVAFPTETVYGLGADAMNPDAAKKIYAAKGRPSDNPLIAHIADLEDMKMLSDDIPDSVYKLALAYWPGPLTMIVKKKAEVPYATSGGLDTIAVRMPSDRIAHELIRLADTPIAAPSANTSGRPSPTKAEHVIEDMDGRIEMIIDGGEVGIGVESTIVDMTGDEAVILRPGAITQSMIKEVLGSVSEDPAIKGPMRADLHPKAPGMKYRHYAPKADMILVDGESEDVVRTINMKVCESIDKGQKVGIIATDETKNRYPLGIIRSIGTRNDEGTIAHNLYDVLRQFDDLEVDVIYSETYRTDELGEAIMNRLMKAAGYHTIHAI